MAYLALYRKYRPDSFDNIVGQQAVVKALRNQVIYHRLSHAYLFCGTRGTGKTSVARVFARAINCEHPVDGNPCGVCSMCTAEQEGFNIIEIDAASNNGVDNIRDLREEVVYSPVQGKYKVYIIDEVHMLSNNAFNALLKTLEEPPAHAVFILATTEPEKVLGTILSRCQRYDFKRLTVDEIRSRLEHVCAQENITLSADACTTIATLADGGMRDALSLLDQCRAYYADEEITLDRVQDVLGTTGYDALGQMTDALLSKDAAALMEGVDALCRAGRDPVQFIQDFMLYLRSCMLFAVMGKRAAEFVTQPAFVQDRMMAQTAGLKQTDLVYYVQKLSQISSQMRTSTQKRITLEAGLIAMLADPSDMAELPAPIKSATPKEKPVMPVGNAAPDIRYSMPVGEKPADTKLAETKPVETKPAAAIASSWDDFVSKQDSTLARKFYKSCVVLEETDNSLHLSADKFIKDNIDLPELETALRDYYGRAVKVSLTESKGTPAKPAAKESAPMSEDLFNNLTDRLGGFGGLE